MQKRDFGLDIIIVEHQPFRGRSNRMATPQGYILIADITGCTQHLNESKFDHDQKT